MRCLLLEKIAALRAGAGTNTDARLASAGAKPEAIQPPEALPEIVKSLVDALQAPAEQAMAGDAPEEVSQICSPLQGHAKGAKLSQVTSPDEERDEEDESATHTPSENTRKQVRCPEVENKLYSCKSLEVRSMAAKLSQGMLSGRVTNFRLCGRQMLRFRPTIPFPTKFLPTPFLPWMHCFNRRLETRSSVEILPAAVQQACI